MCLEIFVSIYLTKMISIMMNHQIEEGLETKHSFIRDLNRNKL